MQTPCMQIHKKGRLKSFQMACGEDSNPMQLLGAAIMKPTRVQTKYCFPVRCGRLNHRSIL